MTQITRLFAYASILFCGAIFGFFYAWVCSTIWGLDAADPRVAIPAMQAMNASVRNGVFALGFFVTLPVLGLTALFAVIASARRAALLFSAAALIYLLGGIILTMQIHVPMNEALATVETPANREDAAAIWTAYSAAWWFWNVVRTVFCGGVLALAAMGLRSLPPPKDV